MPDLVIPEKRDSELKDALPPVKRNWVVTWTLMPFFLADNRELIKHVDSCLMTKFKGRVFFPGDTRILEEMSETVINAILEKFPIKGLREVLESIKKMDLTDTLESA